MLKKQTKFLLRNDVCTSLCINMEVCRALGGGCGCEGHVKGLKKDKLDQLRNDIFEASVKMSLLPQDIMYGYHQTFLVVGYPRQMTQFYAII